MKNTLLLLPALLLSFSIAAQQAEQLYRYQQSPAIPELTASTFQTTTQAPENTSLAQPDFSRAKLKAIVQTAIERLPEQTPMSEHAMTGFYRKLSTQNELYTGLIEAAVLIQDAGYQSEASESSTQVKLLQLRQAKETGFVDSAFIKLSRELGKGDYKPASRNEIYRLLQYNLARHHSKPRTLFHEEGKFAEGSVLTMEEITVEGQDTLYHIVFEDLLMKEGGGHIKINARDFGIVEFERAVYMGGDLMDRTHIRYQKIHGSYYPAFIQVEVPRLVNRAYGEHQLDIHTLWIDTVTTAGITRIDGKAVLPWMQELHTVRLPYDAAFWAAYPMLKLHPLDKETKANLEREQSLESQFLQHSSSAKAISR